MAICKVCGASGAKFCMGCRRRYGGKTVQVTRTVGGGGGKRRARRPRRPRRSSSPSPAPRSFAPRRRAPRKKGPKKLSRLAFLRRMRAGKLAAARARARGGR